MACKICGCLKTACDVCRSCKRDELVQRCLVDIRNLPPLPEKIVKPAVVKPKKKCLQCSQEFGSVNRDRKYCKECLKQRAIRSESQKWLDKKKHVNTRDSNQVAYSFFRIKYGVKNNVFRG